MLKKVLFRNRMEQQAADHNNLQDYASDTLDALVADAIANDKRFAGFQVTSTSDTEVKIAPGRMYSGGLMFSSEAEIIRSLTGSLPAAAEKIVTVMVYSGTEQIDVEPRSYLIDIDARTVEPQANAMTEHRVANVTTIDGIESADPQPAPIASQYVAVCHIRLTPTGIADNGITMVDANRIPQLANVDGRVQVLENWRKQAEPRILTIGSDISALNNKVKGVTSQRMLIEMASDIGRLKDLVGIPDDASSYAADYYLTPAESDTTNLEYLCKLEEGIRFAPDAADDKTVAIYNAMDPAAKVVGGILLPNYTSEPRIDVNAYAGELRLSQYQFQAQTLVQKTMSRVRIRYGQEFSVCTNNRAWWVQGQFDPSSNIFRKGSETFVVLNPEALRGDHSMVRLAAYWEDTYEEPYWDLLTSTTVVNGQTVAQTFLNSQDGWCTAVNIGFTRLAGSGAVRMALCETYRGAPALDKVVAQVEVPRGDLKLYPAEGKTRFPITPTFLSAGTRYAIVIITAADHYAAIASGGDYAQGTLFQSTDGAWFEGDFTRDLVFSVDFARFERVRTVVALQPLPLSGGISSIDILAGMVQPASCQAFFEVQAPGGDWETIDRITPAKLVGLPPLLQFRVVLIGTTDVAPAVQLTGSQVRLSRPRTTFKHISTARTLPAPTSQVRVEVRLENWTDAHHTHAMRLLCGAGFATIETPDVVDTRSTEDPKAIIRTYTFNLAGPQSTYKIEQTGSTTTALDTFLVSTRVDVTF